MKLAKIISMAWIFLAIYTPDQDAILNQKVSLQYKNVGIEQILQDLGKSYAIRFSYMNHEIPADVRVNISIQDQPLHTALDQVLSGTMLTYTVVNGQIILKKDLTKAKKQASSSPRQALPSPAPETSGTVSKALEVEEEKPESSEDAPSDQLATATVSSQQQALPPLAEKEVSSTDDTQEMLPQTKPAPANNKRPYIPTNNQEEEKNRLGKSVQKLGIGLKNMFKHLPGDEDDDYERRSFHLGIIYPLSTNGTEAGKYVNEISVHWLVGYAAGLDGVEFSGFGNIENDFVEGAQFAGFFNLVKHDVRGAQFAGFMNLNGGNMQGGQFSGFLNTAAGEVRGIQGAGFANLATGYTEGVQLSGFINLVANDARAIQAAGFGNFTSGDMEGAQFASFMNYSGDVNVQIAGFMNVSCGDVQGLQASGFLNVARNVQGAQLGVFNVADSVSGVPIGLLSIVRKNGYRKLEVWGSETLHANIALKIGVEKFYNIFAFGSQFADNDIRWGLGYGAGTQINLTSSDHLNLDLISMQIQEDGNYWFEEDKLNLLNTFRVAYHHQFGEYFGLFIAPTFNVMVSQRQNTLDGEIGSGIAPWTISDKTYDNTNVQMWPGFHAGLRF
jgi:hypothetical protein